MSAADRQLMRATGSMAGGTIVSRVTGMVRNTMLIAAIGTGVFADTFTVANTVPNIVYILLVGGALNAVFIPQLVKHMRDDGDEGTAYAQRLITATGSVLLVITALAVALAPWIVRLYGSSDVEHRRLRHRGDVRAVLPAADLLLRRLRDAVAGPQRPGPLRLADVRAGRQQRGRHRLVRGLPGRWWPSRPPPATPSRGSWPCSGSAPPSG